MRPEELSLVRWTAHCQICAVPSPEDVKTSSCNQDETSLMTPLIIELLTALFFPKAFHHHAKEYRLPFNVPRQEAYTSLLETILFSMGDLCVSDLLNHPIEKDIIISLPCWDGTSKS